MELGVALVEIGPLGIALVEMGAALVELGDHIFISDRAIFLSPSP